jgi:hypothetical protein
VLFRSDYPQIAVGVGVNPPSNCPASLGHIDQSHAVSFVEADLEKNVGFLGCHLSLL